ncbi:MAG: S1 RNA-binding domain-containing protein [Thermacetogeniaceae bacterium]|jgi:ribosomal protein S1
MRNLAEGYVGQEKLAQGVSDAWDKIVSAYKRGTIHQARVNAVDSNHGDGQAEGPGLILWIDRVKGVIPFKESSLKTPGDVRDIVGQIVAFKVKDIDEHRQTFTASRKEALEQMAGVTWKTVSPGQVRVAAARAVTKYRVMVDIGGITVPIPAREVSYYWVDDVRDYFGIGDTFDVKVLDVDQENKKVSVSTRALQSDPWQDDPDKLPSKGQRVLGTVAAVKEGAGIYINVKPGFVCFYGQRRHVYVRHAKGDRVLVEVRDVDCEKRRLLVNLIERRNRSYGNSAAI